MSTTPAVTESPTLDWLLKQRIEELGTTFRAVWDYYIKFYTVFLTFSLGAMSWLIAQKDSPAIQRNHRMIAGVFIFQTLLVAGTSLGVAIYSRQTGDKLEMLQQTLLAGALLPAALKKANPVPRSLATWSGLANALAMLGMVLEWWRVGMGLP